MRVADDQPGAVQMGEAGVLAEIAPRHVERQHVRRPGELRPGVEGAALIGADLQNPLRPELCEEAEEVAEFGGFLDGAVVAYRHLGDRGPLRRDGQGPAGRRRALHHLLRHAVPFSCHANELALATAEPTRQK